MHYLGDCRRRLPWGYHPSQERSSRPSRRVGWKWYLHEIVDADNFMEINCSYSLEPSNPANGLLNIPGIRWISNTRIVTIQLSFIYIHCTSNEARLSCSRSVCKLAERIGCNQNAKLTSVDQIRRFDQIVNTVDALPCACSSRWKHNCQSTSHVFPSC